jgi:DNA transformation protein
LKGDSFKDFVLEQLSAAGRIEARAMFGGWGLTREGRFFGIIARDALYLKTDAASRGDFETRGMSFFRPNGKQSLKTYFEVPIDVLEDRDALAAWALRAASVRDDRRAEPSRRSRSDAVPTRRKRPSVGR